MATGPGIRTKTAVSLPHELRDAREPPICSAVKAPTPPCAGAPDRVICVGWERLPALA